MLKRSKEHQMERRVRLLKEAFRTDVERLVKYLKTDEGRMAFQKTLSDEEQLARWLVPEMRQQIMARKFLQEGPDAVETYAKRMGRIMQHMVEEQ